MNSRRLRVYILLLIVSIIWGAAGPIIKFTLGALPPLIFLTYRFAIASLFSVAFLLAKPSTIPKKRGTFLFSLAYGFLMTSVSLGFLFFGTEKTNSIDANLISATAPISVALAGVVFLKEHLTRKEQVGMIIAFLGTLTAVAGSGLNGSFSFSNLEGNVLVFVSVIVGTLNALLAKIMLREEIDPVYLVNISFVVGLVTTLPVTIWTHGTQSILQKISLSPLPYHLGVVYMALISGTLAYTLWHKAQKSIEIGEVGLFAYLYPVFGTPLSLLWLKEKITIHFILGAVLIAAGVLIAEIKKKRYT